MLFSYRISIVQHHACSVYAFSYALWINGVIANTLNSSNYFILTVGQHPLRYYRWLAEKFIEHMKQCIHNILKSHSNCLKVLRNWGWVIDVWIEHPPLQVSYSSNRQHYLELHLAKLWWVNMWNILVIFFAGSIYSSPLIVIVSLQSTADYRSFSPRLPARFLEILIQLLLATLRIWPYFEESTLHLAWQRF